MQASGSEVAPSENENRGVLKKQIDSTAEPSQISGSVYSIYDKREKWLLVGLVAVAGLFSPLPANIYFPAIPTLAGVFHKSTELLNVTVTVYLVMQGVSPMAWGPVSDQLGRRPTFLVCLVILILSCVGLALTPTNAFWLLMLLRCVQAAGCASTIALGAGVIGDVFERAERGSYFAMFNLGPMLAPCIGPAIGGALSEHLGWRSIFWFLVTFAAACFVLILLFLPETLRALVGNGSVQPPAIYIPLVPFIGRGKRIKSPALDKPRRPKFANPFLLFMHVDVTITLLFTGIVYAVNYTITASMASAFAATYPYLSETSLGVCYLSTGGGMLVGSTITGKLLDREYRVVKESLKKSEIETEVSNTDFPIEYARFRTMPIHLLVFCASVFAWGWCLEKNVSIVAPLVFQVLLGYTSIAILNTTMTLMIDILPSHGSSITACTNLIRCSLAAVLVSVIDRMTNVMGYGWAYILLGGICLALLPLMLFEIKFGPKYRQRRQIIEDDKLLELTR
ncbi:major facilitator superfamily domain-containing protein [Leptodontidium sp. MPI-SDFR-AT-0119]|nr:major facilitator superfamily domain-containing protein [Leptodontidium sp. MPI-SDFR-AT-0119]